MLHALRNFQVTHLEIIDSANKCNGDSLENFFLSQQGLEILILEELTKNACVFFNCKNFSYNYKFKLKKISALFCTDYQKSIVFEKNFQTFLSNQSNNIEVLIVKGSLPNSINKLIVSNKFKELYELEMSASSVPQEKSFYENLSITNNLKILKITSTITKDNFLGIKELISHHGGIESLFLIDTDELIANDLFFIIRSKLKNLSNLSVLNFCSNFTPCVTIKSLTSFSIKILNNINQWLSFVLVNENLKIISAGWIQRDFDANIIKQIINNTKIEHMSFGGRFIANKKIYYAIKDDYKKLRTLKLRVSNYDEIKHLKFVFPLDKTYYNSKCLYFEENNDREPLND